MSNFSNVLLGGATGALIHRERCCTPDADDAIEVLEYRMLGRLCSESFRQDSFTRQELLRVSEKLPVHTTAPELTLDLSALNVIADCLWTPSINLAACGKSSTQDLLDRALQVLRHRLEPHRPRDLDDLVERDGLGVLDVLLLLPVSRWLLESFDDQGRRRWDDGDSRLTVLDGEANRDAQTFL
jgi:hypothetical protein